MPLNNTKLSYGSVANFFHWLMALLIITLLAVGFIMTEMENSPDKFKIYGLHKSIGIVILTLAALRLMWKSVNVAPLLPDSMADIEKFAAQCGHALLYLLMFAMPLSGWAMSSAAGLQVSVFGWFTLPNLVAPDETMKQLLRNWHYYLAWAIIAMVSLHVLAALLHHFYHKNNVLRRMLPFVKEENYASSDTATGC